MSEIKKLRFELVALVLLIPNNQSKDKHVESKLVPCLDEGSTPSSSTFYNSKESKSV